MITLTSFSKSDFERFISWIDTEELLITISGTDLRFPVTEVQLQNYLDDDSSFAYNLVDSDLAETVGHAELKKTGPAMLKVDKLLVGSKSSRGRGIGEKAIKALLWESFEKHGSEITELNVFESNAAAIRCYEKCGFKMNPAIRKPFEVNGETWFAVNMRVEYSDWKKTQVTDEKFSSRASGK